MADPLSIAASALAVAGAGGKLSQTLYIFIESVRKSERQLRPVADFIKLTSAVLDNIGSLLGEKDVRELCKDNLLGTTNQALQGCWQAFEELKNLWTVCSRQTRVGRRNSVRGTSLRSCFSPKGAGRADGQLGEV